MTSKPGISVSKAKKTENTDLSLWSNHKTTGKCVLVLENDLVDDTTGLQKPRP
jgi:hypothetical protein